MTYAKRMSRTSCHKRFPVWDVRMRAYRCPACGHRQPYWDDQGGGLAGGQWVPPRQTRELPPWWWVIELLGRRRARKHWNPSKSRRRRG